jgi:hypothetical protein
MARFERGSRFGILSISLGVLILLATAAAWLLVPPRYEAFALLKVSGKPPAVLERRPGAADEFAIFKRTQAQMIRSGIVLNGVLRDAAIHKLSLIKDHSDDPIAYLNDHLVIDFPDDAEIMRIRMTGENRHQVVTIVNKIVEVYLKEVVQRERDVRLEHEAKLQRTYQNMTADLQKQQDSLHALEALHNTPGSESAKLKHGMAIEELDNYLGQRTKIINQMDDTRLQIVLRKAKRDNPEENSPEEIVETEMNKDPVIAKAAEELLALREELPDGIKDENSPTAKRVVQRIEQLESRINERKAQLRPTLEKVFADKAEDTLAESHLLNLTLPMLEKKAEYHEEQLKKIDEVIEKQVEHVKTLDNFNASVAGKQEDMRALQRITKDLRNELDRIKVEQLVPERIIKLDDATLANGRGDTVRNNVAALLAGALGLGLIVLGAAFRGPREPPPASEL